MVLKAVVSGDVALAFLGEDIPAIGPSFHNREEAMKAAQQYLDKINELSVRDQNMPFQIVLNKQADGRYSLVVDSSQQMVSTLSNLDELIVKRFRKGLKKKLFILTCFVEGVDGLECLVLTEGLGAVFYAPNAVGTY
ncbi:hypothetical protein [Pelotomaculum sp. PtaB.Bin117]|uniref:hypothetical protein n=1 Tax=Pelotomaculum sp. PtaB.Bin117 TaxID=1811694 RepID=UPI0009CD3EA2|nr:hypothetical protein [Pelotomaculum sp. PtaB.Bin117]OPX84651.1 MAG: hypothetical protein A4E54_02836 [Pelotomaculum sp. PtaB.Bin117]OPY63307.1 MAG: hypothetical protein A4E56_00657 [Pelotomaculum sp. PtaU1.Bin065]